MKVVEKANVLMQNIVQSYRESGEDTPSQDELDCEIKRLLIRYFQNLVLRCTDGGLIYNKTSRTLEKASYAVEYSKTRFLVPKPVISRSERKGRVPDSSWLLRD